MYFELEGVFQNANDRSKKSMQINES